MARAGGGRLEARDRFRGAAHFGTKPIFLPGLHSCVLWAGRHGAHQCLRIARSRAHVALLTQKAGSGVHWLHQRRTLPEAGSRSRSRISIFTLHTKGHLAT